MCYWSAHWILDRNQVSTGIAVYWWLWSMLEYVIPYDYGAVIGFSLKKKKKKTAVLHVLEQGINISLISSVFCSAAGCSVLLRCWSGTQRSQMCLQMSIDMSPLWWMLNCIMHPERLLGFNPTAEFSATPTEHSQKWVTHEYLHNNQSDNRRSSTPTDIWMCRIWLVCLQMKMKQLLSFNMLFKG